MTHNTANCKKYGKDGSIKKCFKKPSSQSDSKKQNFATILKEGFAELTKILKDKKPSKKRTIEDSADSNWLIGWSSTRELELVENKPKKVKLESYNFPGPIKTTQLESNTESSKLEQNFFSLSKNRVTTIVAVSKAGPKFRAKNNCPKPSN